MSSSFNVVSAAGGLVSLLNTVDISPMDCVQHDSRASPDQLSEAPALQTGHVCGECDRMFSTTGHLNRHLTMHAGTKDHPCPYSGCSNRTTRYDNLVQHYRIHLPRGEHNREASYVRTKMENTMDELGIARVCKTRSRSASNIHLPLQTIFVKQPTDPISLDQVFTPSPRPSLSSESSGSFPPSSSSDTAVSSPSTPLLTPPLAPSPRAHPDLRQYIALHRSEPYEPAQVYQTFPSAVDYARNFRVLNARKD